MNIATVVAWLCVSTCVTICGRTAAAFLKGTPRLFTVIALFACVWALLLPYYGRMAQGDDTQSLLFVAFGGFLLVYIGALMKLEANRLSDNADDGHVVPLQSLGLFLFTFFVFQTGYSLYAPNRTIFTLTPAQTEKVIAVLLDVAGYISVVYGAWALCTRSYAILLTTILIIYSGSEISYTLLTWENQLMPDCFKYVFAAEKLIFTSVFCYAIALKGMPAPDRPKGFVIHLQKFFALR
jgi:hypothetical protein